MGRTQVKKKLKLKSNNSVKNSKETSVPELVEKARSLIVQCDYQLALKFVQRILTQEPLHPEATEILGLIQLETGDPDSAKSTFTKLLTLAAASQPPPSAHLYLAQLSEDSPQDALRHFQAAIDILMNQLKGKFSDNRVAAADDDDADIRQNIVQAYIGQVEIWMDPSYDLCFDPAAEQTCEQLLDSALQISPANPEALQSLASVRMSQQRPDEAKACLEQAWSSWKDLEPDDDQVPPIPSRLSLAKLFLELHLFHPALHVLNGIMATDDQLVEAWYLEGWCFFMMAEQAKSSGETKKDNESVSWQDLARDSRDCLEACRTLYRSQDYPDPPMLEHINELIEQLEALGISPSKEEEDGDGEWEDEVSSSSSDNDERMEE